jgi:hypothetical protein
MAISDQILIEAAKVGAQLSGTALIGWLAVRWALGRYKREKMWEHRLTAYTKAVAAVGEMLVISSHHLADAEQRVERTKEYQNLMTARFRAAKAEFQQSIAISRLTLPAETYDTLVKLDRDLHSNDGDTLQELYDGEVALLRRALDQIVGQGRSALR